MAELKSILSMNAFTPSEDLPKLQGEIKKETERRLKPAFRR